MQRADILNILTNFFKSEESIDYETKFDKDSMDSMDKINLLILLEEELSVELSIVELYKCDTLCDLCNLCLEAVND